MKISTVIRSFIIALVAVVFAAMDARVAHAEEILSVDELSFYVLSENQIALTWKDSESAKADRYVVKRRQVGRLNAPGEWVSVAQVATSPGGIYQVTDPVNTSEATQFEYMVSPIPGAAYTTAIGLGKSIYASNLKLCLDPGHYAGENQVLTADGYGYSEGDFTIRIGNELGRTLREHGIDVYMTRTGGSITIDGLTDKMLDKGNIKLRGVMAGRSGSRLLLSLHTNSNNENANGFPTLSQPAAINKPIILANTIACRSPKAIEVANNIGVNLASVTNSKGLSTLASFRPVLPGQVSQWTTGLNDGLNIEGSVYCRLNNKNEDYYGVHKGASSVGVPALIIEHGFHSNANMRWAAMTSDLYQAWAWADLMGILNAYGFV